MTTFQTVMLMLAVIGIFWWLAMGFVERRMKALSAAGESDLVFLFGTGAWQGSAARELGFVVPSTPKIVIVTTAIEIMVVWFQPDHVELAAVFPLGNMQAAKAVAQALAYAHGIPMEEKKC